MKHLVLLLALIADTHPFESKTPKKFYMFTATWCVPCQVAKKELHGELDKLGWKINEEDDAHIQIINSDKRPDLIEKFQIESIPCFATSDGKTMQYPKDAEVKDRVGKVCKMRNDFITK